MSGLEELAPTPRSVRLGDREFEVRPLKLRQLPAFEAAIRGVAPLLVENKVAEAMAINAEGMLEALRVATGADRESLEALEVPEVVKLAEAVVEVNEYFFARALAPALEEARAWMGKLLAAQAMTGGSSSSRGSADGATGSESSST